MLEYGNLVWKFKLDIYTCVFMPTCVVTPINTVVCLTSSAEWQEANSTAKNFVDNSDNIVFGYIYIYIYIYMYIYYI